MSDRKDGGPAFPQKEPLTDDWQGMALRDYFAAKAMQGLLAAYPDMNRVGLAKESYAMADALLSKREGGGV